ncbi:MAG: class I SAM-dependent methyltransferase, partial [Pseudobdellovibrio sp.]
MISYFKYFLFKNRRNKFIESTYKAEDPWSSALNFEAVDDFIKSFVKETNSVILDIGCGEGLYSDLLKSIARQYIGVDISKIAIARARKKHSLNADMNFLNLDFDQIPKNGLRAEILCFNFVLDYLGFQQFPMAFSSTLFEV